MKLPNTDSPTFTRKIGNILCFAIVLKFTKNQQDILNHSSLPHSRYCCHRFGNVFFPSEVARFFFLLVVIIVGNWKLFILPFHQHFFYFTNKPVLLFLKVDSVYSFQAILFLFFAFVMIFHYRMKEKRQNADLTGIQSTFIPLSYPLFFFLFPPGYSSFRKPLVLFIFI